MNKRRLFLLSFSIVCIVIIGVGLLYWASGQWTEQKLQGYIERLEKRGIYIEEHSISDFQVGDSISLKFFSDFTFDIDFEGISQLYFDREICGIYFLNPKGDRLVAHIFYYEGKS